MTTDRDKRLHRLETLERDDDDLPDVVVAPDLCTVDGTLTPEAEQALESLRAKYAEAGRGFLLVPGELPPDEWTAKAAVYAQQQAELSRTCLEQWEKEHGIDRS